MVTAPADKRLMTAAARRERASASFLQINARAWSAAGIRACRCQIDQGEWLAMTPVQDTTRWALPQPLDIAPRWIVVEAQDNDGRMGEDRVEVDPAPQARAPVGVGSDADSIGAWPENHVLGTQLGPNRNGRHW
jgi:3',5'-cyclic-AMP phosphodiesterase